TESDNDVGGYLDTGLYFAEGGNGNFTTMYLGTGNTNGSFLQFDGAQRTSAWAVDILGVDSAVLTIAPPPITSFQLLSNHQFQVQFHAEAGLTYALQASTNLTAWFEVTNTMLLANGPLQFTDPAATNSTRFYRLSVH
ncbi:MAG: LamG domain protein jellyroll fold domain protein, partial [Pedosphaera sp.]|nr:LamG domain protein jellyroll fold domain protein [Pedosphaera sp.]